MKHVYLIVILLVSTFTVKGSNYSFISKNIEGEVPDRSAISFWQDGLGRIWFGNSALNVYNGVNTSTYYLSDYLPDIENANIRQLCGNDSILYFLADNELITLNYHTVEFRKTGLVAQSILYKDKMLYYVINNNLYSYDPSSLRIELVLTIEQEYFSHLCAGSANALWIGSSKGVYKLNLETKAYSRYLQNTAVLTLFEDSEKNIWIGTRERNVYVLQKESNPVLLMKNGIPLEAHVHMFCEDKYNQIWIGSVQGGFVYKKRNHAYECLSAFQENDPLTALYVDLQENIWLGSFFGEIRYIIPNEHFKIRTSLNKFTGNNVLEGVVMSSMTEDSAGNLYVGTQSKGINIINRDSQKVHHINTKNSRLKNDKVRGIWCDKEKNRLVVGNYKKGMQWIDLKTKKIHPIVSELFRNEEQATCEQIIPYKNYLILVSQDGIFKMNSDNYEISHFFADEEMREATSGLNRCIHIDDKDRMWISTFRRGIFLFDIKSESLIARFNTLPSPVKSICGNTKDGIFLATFGTGILRYTEMPEDPFRELDTPVHQSGKLCWRILMTPAKNLIVISDNGISFLELTPTREINSISRFSLTGIETLKGISSECGTYIDGHEEYIYIGSFNGLLRIKENFFRIKRSDFQLSWGELMVNGNITTPLNTDFLKKDIAFTTALKLPYSQNTFALTVGHTDYNSLFEKQLEYRLEGRHEYWLPVNENRILYSSLDPGRYTLKVREKEIPEKEIVLNIQIENPWWFSTYAKICYFLLLLAGGALYLKIYQKKEQLRARVWEELSEKERIIALQKKRSDLFVMLSNEFREPLTHIMTFLNQTLDLMHSGNKKKIQGIYQQLSYMEEIINEIHVQFSHPYPHDNITESDYNQLSGNMERLKTHFKEFTLFKGLNLPDHPEEINDEEYPDILTDYTIFLVDSNQELTNLLRASFAAVYKVTEICDGNEVYERAVKESPDLIVCEVTLTGISGIEICNKLKNNIHTLDIPVILLSREPSKEQEIQAIKAGAEYYMAKPFNLEILLQRASQAINSRLKINSKYSQEAVALDGSSLFATSSQESKFLQEVRRVAERNMENADFDTQLWSRELGIGRTNLFKMIKKITGMTPNEYLLYLKMEKAVFLLKSNENESISEIAYKLGFTTPVYFSRCFKKIIGVAPAQYRKGVISEADHSK